MSEKCYHCGEDCVDSSISIEDKPFCCEGCKTVYSILKTNELDGFYSLEEQGGTKTALFQQNKYAYLNEPEIISSLLDYQDDEISMVSFYIPKIHCSSCIWLLEKLYKIKRGIKVSTVNFTRKTIRISFNPKEISLREVVESLHSIGYEPSINLKNLDKEETRGIEKSLWYKIGVAGFAFGNIMLAALPEYFATPEQPIDPKYAELFQYLSMVLAIPVVLYSASDYFKSAFYAIKNKGINIDIPIAIGVATLFIRSVYEVVYLHQPGYFDSLAGLVFYLLIGKAYQSKTYSNIAFDRDYKSYFPISVVKLNQGKEYVIPLTHLKKGDRMLIRNDEIIPADSILISKEASIDSSFITGEEKVLQKQSGDKIFAGCRQVGSAIEVEVVKTINQSELTSLWNDAKMIDHKSKDDFQSITNKISSYFTIAVLLIALVALIYWLRIDTSIAINVFTSVLIVACPCALALAAPISFGQAIRKFGKAKLYYKDTTSVERSGHIDEIVFDKTGTITQAHSARITFVGAELSSQESSEIRSGFRNSYHPLSLNLYNHLANYPIVDIAHFNESGGKGIEFDVGGHHYKLGSAGFCEIDIADELALQTRVYIKKNDVYRGYFSFSNEYRAELKKVLTDLNSYQLSVITGDNESEKEKLEHYFGAGSRILFNQSPIDKLNYIKELQNKSLKVLMIGDGLNDAGALSQSDVGISISEDTNNFSPACDAILDASNFHLLPQFLRFSRMTIKTVKISMIISLLYNVIGLSFAVQGLLSPLFSSILMPTSSISVVLLSTLLINYYARSLES
jgi:Cu+-exporting ATPase